MELHYTTERNVQIVIALLKANNIRKVVASPGTTNITFIGSIMHDPFFEIYSSVDERSAAYIACGLAEESGEPVAISCTGATASRNYFSGLTEAFYRHLPILAITSTQDESYIGHMKCQVIDRTQQPRDIVKYSVHLQTIKDAKDEWDVVVKANAAILELNHHGTGPVHINLTTTYSKDFSVVELPPVRRIRRITHYDTFPQLPNGRIAVFIGSHLRCSEELTQAIDAYCSCHNAVVFCEPVSNYHGKYRLMYQFPGIQRTTDTCKAPDLLIHIGEMSDFADTYRGAKQVWRVNEDGVIRDRFQKLTYMFEMPEVEFFKHYVDDSLKGDDSYLKECKENYKRVFSKLPELPFANLWMVSKLYDKIPDGSELHLGILNSFRAWSFFEFNNNIDVFCNEGGFGIDGDMSAMIGASLVHPDKLYFGIVGDLAFFYDMNVLGNHIVGNNIRLLLVNNGCGSEFHMKGNPGSVFEPETDKFMAAGGHFGNKSKDVVRHLTADWGYDYITASNKEEFISHLSEFLSTEPRDKSLIFEVFTDIPDEVDALGDMGNAERNTKAKVKDELQAIVGEKAVDVIKNILGK